MAATPEIIPTDLTLEIGDDPTPEQFMKAATAFFGFIAETSRQVAPEADIPRWVVRVREGSDLLALHPTDTPTQWHRAVYKQAAKGIRTLTEDGVSAWRGSESALRHLTVLSEMTRGPKNKPTTLRLWVERKPIAFDATIAAKVREEEQLGYHDFGTVEGYLDTLQDRNGSLVLRVKDAALGITVRCYFTEEQLPDAFGKFRHRVEVSGVINYRKDGLPISVRVENIEALPDDSDLPTPLDVLGILRETA